jgi:cation diffusion facilitator family transporter
MPPPSGKLSVYVALASNLAIAVTKFGAAAFTGSSAMLSEGVHSLVDTTNELLLLYGIRRAARPPDIKHPLGHGRELYFWSFIVALLVLVFGAAVAGYEGINHILHPVVMRHHLANYLVLGASFLFEGASWWVGLKAFRATQGRQGYFEAFRNSKDPTTFTVLFEDSAALAGLLIAAAGIAAAQAWRAPWIDGLASVGIACVLLVSSLLLARETKDLLIGEPARPHLRDAILRLAAADRDVRNANGVITVQLGPDQIVAALSVEFREELTAVQIESCVERVEAAIKAAMPEVTSLFVKPQKAAIWNQRRGKLEVDPTEPSEPGT